MAPDLTTVPALVEEIHRLKEWIGVLQEQLRSSRRVVHNIGGFGGVTMGGYGDAQSTTT